jgi:PKD domain
VLVVLAAAAALAPSAAALIRPAITIDGPSADIISLGGVAMAPDGTGGLVYLKRDQGEPHVFVSRFIGGQWQAPVRVDSSLPFDSSWPQIGAGDHGRLVVVWAQSYAQTNGGVPLRQMYSSALKPGSGSFLPPIAFDANLSSANATGDEAVSELDPSLSMNASGQAYLLYHVITNGCQGSCGNAAQGTYYRAGDVFADVRLARFNGETWSVLGAINRNQAFSVRPGTSANSPEVAIDSRGNGVAAFQEQDETGFDRIWARRLFGSQIGHILQASPATFNGSPVNGDADAFSLSAGASGAAVVAYRQQSAPGSAFSSPRVLENELSTSTDPAAGDFEGAQPIDGGLGGVGVPGVALTEPGLFSADFGATGTLEQVVGTLTYLAPPLSVGLASGGDRPGVTIAPDGSTVSAWPSSDGFGQPVVHLQQSLADGRSDSGTAAANVGGPISNLKLAGSGEGDALVAFQQGQGADTQIAANVVQAPPGPFSPLVPLSWVKPRGAVVSWLPPTDEFGALTYTLLVNGVVRRRDMYANRYRFDPATLKTGVYQVSVVATDASGQQTMSSTASLEVDRTPPHVRLTRSGRHVEVTISDGSLDRNSGVNPGRTWARFGDGTRRTLAQVQWFPIPHGVATHTYRGTGRFTITVHAVDNAGNTKTYHLHVSLS